MAAAQSSVAFPTSNPLRILKRYFLRFTFQIVFLTDAVSLYDLTRLAKKQMRNPDFWQPYLERTMRFGMNLQLLERELSDYNHSEGPTIPAPPCEDIHIRLESQWNDEDPDTYHAVVEWSSAECDLNCLGEAVYKYISIRMGRDLISSKRSGWAVYLSPGILGYLDTRIRVESAPATAAEN